MKTKTIWTILGVSAFSLVLGFLIGSSNSPVLGAALSSLFGVIIASIGLIEKEKGESFKIHFDKLILTGKILFAFSILLFAGLLAGDNYRNNNIGFLKEEQFFPWKNRPPESTYEALDWIVTAQKLKRMGYTADQIVLLYEIRVKEIHKYKNEGANEPAPNENDYGYEEKDDSGYDKSSPFNAVISDNVVESAQVTRGPASEE